MGSEKTESLIAEDAEDFEEIVMQITVIYPTYNEEKNIHDTIDRSLTALRGLFENFEILIVNDCSRDSTPRLAEELAARHPEVRVLHNEKNLRNGRRSMQVV